MKTGRRLSREEQRLWQGFVAGVKPLPGKTIAVPPPDEVPSIREPAGAPAHIPASPPKPRTPAPLSGLEKALLKKLASGRIIPEARLDLHGFRQVEAYRALIDFLHRAQSSDRRLVLVISGKGSRVGGGILRNSVPLWLADPALRGIVLGFAEAGALHGGAGALYVRLRRRRG